MNPPNASRKQGENESDTVVVRVGDTAIADGDTAAGEFGHVLPWRGFGEQNGEHPRVWPGQL
ncbi:hypothetical protein [Gordonia sp. NPDC003376]